MTATRPTCVRKIKKWYLSRYEFEIRCFRCSCEHQRVTVRLNKNAIRSRLFDLRGPARTTIASRSQWPASPTLILVIEAKENTLTLRGEKQTNDEEKGGDVLYQGIAARNFERSFQLADHVQVKGASLEKVVCTSTGCARSQRQ